MKLKIWVPVIAALALCPLAFAAEAATAPSNAQLPRVFSVDANALRAVRDHVATGKLSYPALDSLRARADKFLKQELVSVVQKSITPPSGDKHDYMSLAPYWWPDPTKPGGLPYIRRDGERNPEIKTMLDHEHCDQMITSTYTLALAYYVFGDEKYAEAAAKSLRLWFLDPATRMNPNMQFAQAVRGKNEGRGIGLIETHRLSSTVDAIGLLNGSKSWTEADQKGVQDWFAKYLKWVLDSDNGHDESQSRNNHGSYYDVQVTSIALFTGNNELAAKVLKKEPKRIVAQIEKNGGQPLELERTKALSYSTFNLTALFQLASLGQHVGVDLWNFKGKDGASIRQALDFLTPYVAGEKKWSYKQIEHYDSTAIVPLYLTASLKYHAPEYEQVARKIDPNLSESFEYLLARFAPKN
jgi:hypothetical protein